MYSFLHDKIADKLVAFLMKRDNHSLHALKTLMMCSCPCDGAGILLTLGCRLPYPSNRNVTSTGAVARSKE